MNFYRYYLTIMWAPRPKKYFQQKKKKVLDNEQWNTGETHHRFTKKYKSEKYKMIQLG